MNSPRYRWVILFLCSYVTVCYAFVFQSIPPILPNLISDLAISYTQAGALMGSFALPAIVVALPFGYLMDRFGIQKVGVTTLAIFALGTGVVAWSETYSSVLVGRIICGIGAAAVLVYTPSAIADWFKDRETGLAMGLFNTAVPLGTIIALMTLGVIAELRGWGFALIVAAAASVTALVLFVALYRDDERKALTSAGNGSGALRTIIKDAGGTIWVLATIWATFGAGYMQYFTFATEFFVAQDYDAEQAGLYASGPMWIGLLAAPASGLLLDRLGRPWLFLLFGTVGLGASLSLIPLGPDYLLAAIIMVGISASALATTIMTLPPSVMPLHTLGFGYGVLTAAMGIGLFVGGVGLGFLRDITDSGTSVFFGMAAIMLFGAMPTLMLRDAGVRADPSG